MGISSNLGTAARSSSNGRSDAQWGAINATDAAVVLGARNLGAAITSDLLERGVRVATVARTRGDLDLLERGGAVPLQADAADPEQLGQALAGAAAQIGPLDLIVNAVFAIRPPDDGSGFGGGPLISASMAGFEGWTVPVARQAFVALKVGARALHGRGGAIVQVVGAPARRANPERGLMAAGGAAVRALTHAAAQELRAEGIHVALLIVDGIIASPKTAQMSRKMASDALVRQQDVIAMIAFATERGLRVAPQSIGHAAGALDDLAGALLLKISSIRGVRIDPDARTARAQAGALWTDVTAAAAPHGLAALAGSAADVGVVGIRSAAG